MGLETIKKKVTKKKRNFHVFHLLCIKDFAQYFCVFFKDFSIYFRDRERESMSRRKREREGERNSSRLHAEHRARHRARSHDPEITT